MLDEHEAESSIVDAARAPPDPSDFDMCFIAASLHAGKYQAAVIDYVRRYQQILAHEPSAFLSQRAITT